MKKIPHLKRYQGLLLEPLFLLLYGLLKYFSNSCKIAFILEISGASESTAFFILFFNPYLSFRPLFAQITQREYPLFFIWGDIIVPKIL